MADITVSLPDGSTRTLPSGATAADLAADIGSGLARDAIAAVIDGEERDLVVALADGATVEIVTPSTDRGLETLRHSTAHVLAQASLDRHVDVFQAVVWHPAAAQIIGHGVQAALDCLHLIVGEQADLTEHGGVGHAAGDVLFPHQQIGR